MKLYRASSKISIQIADAIFTFSPLTTEKKAEIASLSLRDAMAAVRLTIKYGLKDLKGCIDDEDNEYKLKFDDNGVLLDECIDDICNPEVEDKELTNKIYHTCLNFINGIPNKIINYQTNEEVEGVKILRPTKEAEKK